MQGEKVASSIKSAILLTLTKFLQRIPQHVKPFFPQLGRIFDKAKTEADMRVVSLRADEAIEALAQARASIAAK